MSYDQKRPEHKSTKRTVFTNIVLWCTYHRADSLIFHEPTSGKTNLSSIQVCMDTRSIINKLLQSNKTRATYSAKKLLRKNSYLPTQLKGHSHILFYFSPYSPLTQSSVSRKLIFSKAVNKWLLKSDH